MKTLLTLAISFSSLFVFSQEFADNITETDCDGKTESVDDAIAANNTPLLVIASGYDCGICRSEAPGFDTMADTLVGQARVWGAMHNRFSNTDPSCSGLESWKSSYGWDNIFIFNDVNNGTSKSWAQGGYTSYTVIARDKEYLYKGTNRTTALNAFFEEIKNKPTSISSLDELGIKMRIEGNDLYLESSDYLSGAIQVVNSKGMRVGIENLDNEKEKLIPLKGVNRDMLIVSYLSNSGQKVSQKIVK